jgi:hypothetical protein
VVLSAIVYDSWKGGGYGKVVVQGFDGRCWWSCGAGGVALSRVGGFVHELSILLSP